ILKGNRNDVSPEICSYAVENFRIAAGLSDQPYRGTVCNDSEVGKWIEAAAYSLKYAPDPAMEEEIDALVDLIVQAQMPDGYLNTYFQALYPDKRFKHFAFNCELYNMGHLMEAAAAYYAVTGKRKMLDSMCSLADLLCTVIGPGPEQLHVYDGHAEIELGLLALYEATGVKRYLDLCAYFVNERGRQPSFLLEESSLHREDPSILDRWFGLDHHQAHAPVAQQKHADGHAVKLTYLLCAAEDLSRHGKDEEGKLKEAADRIWENMTLHRMYITGAIGSQGYGERFTVDDDLPSDHGYAETCASIGIAFWGNRMLQRKHDSAIADVVETALYNGMLVGWSLDGTRYNYTNILHCKNDVMSYRQDQQYLSLQRKLWYECACCPSNILRVVCSIEKYLFSASEDTLYINSYASAGLSFQHGGKTGGMEIQTAYPYDGKVSIRYAGAEPASFRLALRIPDWCASAVVRVNGQIVRCACENGYRIIHREWCAGDEIALELQMEAELYGSSPAIFDTAGKAALRRGPLVYCLESIDHDGSLAGVTYAVEHEARTRWGERELSGILLIEMQGYRKRMSEKPYGRLSEDMEPCRITGIPYFAWGNRGVSDMDVWLPYK
ncbi:MAG: glycoside hydrolase family 127 protein, partial [Clostridia bacterium]|nr:glycoside hydrolase family 127 protein [Clostridia bacterium]